jgi:pimeloyl-ACP methyl ester carboxylesterase
MKQWWFYEEAKMPKMLVNSLNVYYETHGEGESLVFIHGLGSSTQDWERQLDYFSSRYQVILVDVRGHGQTDKPPGPYSVPLFAQDLAGLLDTLGIPSAHICGISMGGMIAFQMAVDYPKMVKTLTVVNSGADLVPKNLNDRWKIFQRLVIFRLLSMEKIGETLSKRIFIKPEQEELRTVFVEHWSKNIKPAYMAAMQALVGWTVEDMLGEIACPTLVIAADEDYTPLEDKQQIVTKMKNAELVVIEDSRHATPVEHPELFNQSLGAFIARNNN